MLILAFMNFSCGIYFRTNSTLYTKTQAEHRVSTFFVEDLIRQPKMVIKDKSTTIKLINITKSGPICKQKKGFFFINLIDTLQRNSILLPVILSKIRKIYKCKL